jgi:hypothetical protein
VLKWGHQEEHGIQPAARCAVCGTNTPTGVAVLLHPSPDNPAGPGAILVCNSPACRAAAQRTADLVIPLTEEAS